MKPFLIFFAVLCTANLYAQKEEAQPKKLILQSFVNPTFTREILGSYSHETKYIRKFRPAFSGGIGIKKELKTDKWYIGLGLLYQKYKMSEKSYSVMFTDSKTTNTIYKADYITMPLTVSYRKNNLLFSIGLTNSMLLNKETYVNNQLVNSLTINGENWLTGFDGKIGYLFEISQKSSVVVELYGNVNTYSLYFPKTVRYGFEIGYYTFGLSLSYNFRIV